MEDLIFLLIIDLFDPDYFPIFYKCLDGHQQALIPQ